jgi:hypothetical protein
MAKGSRHTPAMTEIRPPPKGLGRTGKGSSRRWGRCYDNRELFPLFECSDFETLLEKLTEILISRTQFALACSPMGANSHSHHTRPLCFALTGLTVPPARIGPPLVLGSNPRCGN